MKTKERLKILITTDLYTVKTNGVVTSVKNLFDELVKMGHDVRILTLSSTHSSYKENPVYYIRSIPLKGIYPNLRMPTSYRHKLMKEIINWKPDIIHSQCEFFSYQFAKRISTITEAPIIHTYHTLYEQYITSYIIPCQKLGNFLVKTFSRKRLKSVKTLIAPTKKVERILKSYGIKCETEVVPSGISLTQHRQQLTKEERLNRRSALGIGEHETVFLNLGRLGTEKNLPELLQLFAKALQDNKNFKFLIVGDGPAKKELQRLVEKLNVRDFVIFTGMVPQNEVQVYYQLGDVFISASTSETQGLTYIEAAANGLPLLCRSDSCLEEILEVGKNGYVYSNEEEFLNAVNSITQNKLWRVEAAKASKKMAFAFDKHIFAERMVCIYKDAILISKQDTTVIEL